MSSVKLAANWFPTVNCASTQKHAMFVEKGMTQIRTDFAVLVIKLTPNAKSALMEYAISATWDTILIHLLIYAKLARLAVFFVNQYLNARPAKRDTSALTIFKYVSIVT